jgi:hypothetical protein
MMNTRRMFAASAVLGALANAFGLFATGLPRLAASVGCFMVSQRAEEAIAKIEAPPHDSD